MEIISLHNLFSSELEKTHTYFQTQLEKDPSLEVQAPETEQTNETAPAPFESELVLQMKKLMTLITTTDSSISRVLTEMTEEGRLLKEKNRALKENLNFLNSADTASPSGKVNKQEAGGPKPQEGSNSSSLNIFSAIKSGVVPSWGSIAQKRIALPLPKSQAPAQRDAQKHVEEAGKQQQQPQQPQQPQQQQPSQENAGSESIKERQNPQKAASAATSARPSQAIANQSSAPPNNSMANSGFNDNSKEKNSITKYYRLPQMYENVDIKEFIDIHTKNINFGYVLPGYILEEDLEIFNKSSENLVIKISVVCHNPDLAELDEYVYSLRKATVYDYNEKYLALIAPNSSVKFKIALKVPNIKQETLIKGGIFVCLYGFESTIDLPVNSFVKVPRIVCPRELFCSLLSCKVIRLAAKKGKKQDCKIPFRNLSAVALTLEVDFIDNNNNKELAGMVDISAAPNVLNIQANSLFVLNLTVRQNFSQTKLLDSTTNLFKKILIVKIRNSTIMYPFPVVVELY